MKRAAVLITGLLAGVLVLAAACGGDDATATPRPRATSPPAATQPPAPTSPPATQARAPTSPPAATEAPAATPTSLGISVNGDALEFDKSEFSVGAGSQVVLTLNNVSTVNQHNWVLVKAGTKDVVSARGTAAGPANDWVQPDDPDAIEYVRLLAPGEAGEVSFAAPPPGTYQFVCTFPGHNFTMFGDFEVTG